MTIYHSYNVIMVLFQADAVACCVDICIIDIICLSI